MTFVPHRSAHDEYYSVNTQNIFKFMFKIDFLRKKK